MSFNPFWFSLKMGHEALGCLGISALKDKKGHFYLYYLNKSYIYKNKMILGH